MSDQRYERFSILNQPACVEKKLDAEKSRSLSPMSDQCCERLCYFGPSGPPPNRKSQPRKRVTPPGYDPSGVQSGIGGRPTASLLH
jgi:hypothetical protein